MVGSSGLDLTWLGQSGFLVESSEHRIACDLYLSDHLAGKYAGSDKPHDRLHAAPRQPEDVGGLDFVFASHRHSDHLDPGSIGAVLEASPAAVLVLPAPVVDYAVDELGLPPGRLRGVHPGERVGPFELLPAAHPHPGPEFLSTIITSGGLRLFHSGDTLVSPDLEQALARGRPDVVLLPANGRVAEAVGTPPNMSLDEAVALARACGARLLIPHHYDMFAFNSVPPDVVRSRLTGSGLDHLVMEVGQTVRLAPEPDGGVRVGSTLVDDLLDP